MGPPSMTVSSHEKQAIMIMFGGLWKKKFTTLDGQKGRPSVSDCIDFALRRVNKKAGEDLVDYLEQYLFNMSKRCQASFESRQSE